MTSEFLCPSCSQPQFPDSAFCTWCGTVLGGGVADEGAETRAETLYTGEAPSPDESWTSIAERVEVTSHGKYKGVRLLGQGGMGIVFLARDEELQRSVAVKVLSPSWLSDDRMVERFRLEARTIAALRHESIVNVYDVGRAGEFYYFVMDFIEGVPLNRLIRTHGRLPVSAVNVVLYEIGSALDYAHRRANHVVHRDVKPSNIMLDENGHAVVMDFGVSKVVGGGGGLTRTGLVLGTPEYMSPEQGRGAAATPNSDQYSLGVVAYAMLTGAPPFTGPFYQVLMAHQSEPVPPLRAARPDCPAQLADAIERMMAKSPTDRWPSLGDMLRSLDIRPVPMGAPAHFEVERLVAEARVGSSQDAEPRSAESTAHTASSLRIVPHPEELEPGDTISLRAQVVFANGVEEAGRHVSWESTDPSIVSVDASSGELMALGAGTALVRATGEGLEECVTVTVSQPRVSRIVISPDEFDIEVASTLELSARVLDKRGEGLDRPVRWSSGDSGIVAVSESGVVTGCRPGPAVVLAHCEGVGATANARVKLPTGADRVIGDGGPAVAVIELDAPSDTVMVGEDFHATAVVLDARGRRLNVPVEWSTEDPDLLESLGEGGFRCIESGEAGVLATAGGRVARARVRVGSSADMGPWDDPGADGADGATPVVAGSGSTWMTRRTAIVAVVVLALGGLMAALWGGGSGIEREISGEIGTQLTDARGQWYALSASFTWVVGEGALPTGVSLESSGELIGTPTIAGSFDFTAVGTDPNGEIRRHRIRVVVNDRTVRDPGVP